MGSPGEHWLTDIVTWQRSVFGSPADDLVRELARFLPPERLGDAVAGCHADSPAEFATRLMQLVHRIRSEARGAGAEWETV